MLRASSTNFLKARLSASRLKPYQQQIPCSSFSTNISKSPLGKSTSWLADKLKLRSPQQIVADPDNFNRWMIVPAAVGTHLSLGSVFAFSMLTQPMMHLDGVVAAAASDWNLAQVMPVFSTLMATFGASSFLLGRFGVNERLGPRITGLTGSLLFAGAFSVAAAAAELHSLPLLYAGYGLMGGLTVGVCYVNPISTLIKWFPDRKGLASAMAVMGFGAGGMVAAPLMQTLLRHFQKAPQFVGTLDSIMTETREGRLFAHVGAEWQEVVVATRAGLSSLGEMGHSLPEGLYLVGTGATGLTETFVCLGALYSCAIAASAVAFRTPPEGYQGPRADAVTVSLRADLPTQIPVVAPPPDKREDSPSLPAGPVDDRGGVSQLMSPAETEASVSPSAALRTSTFWLMWAGMCFNCAGAYTLIGGAKPMLMDMFAGPYPDVVTSAFAAAFVSALSFFNLSGRVAWGAVADARGTAPTMSWLWGLGVPAYLAMPVAAHLASPSAPAGTLAHSTLLETAAALAPLSMFAGAAMLAISTFGGAAAVSPAYLADLFGRRHVAAIHGQLLSFLLVAGYLGPMLCSTLAQIASRKATAALADMLSDEQFVAAFGAPRAELEALVAAKTVTIPRLLELLPVDTIDPTPFLHDNTLFALAALQLAALGCNALIRRSGRPGQALCSLATPPSRK